MDPTGIVCKISDMHCSYLDAAKPSLLSPSFFVGLQGAGDLHVVVDDSREGWRNALKVLLEAYFFGHRLPVFDMSQLR